MFRRTLLPFCAVLVSFGLVAGCLNIRAQEDDSHHGRKYKVPPAAARIEVTVVRDYNGKPIADAHVIFHPIEGDKDKGALELKTNEDGKALIEVIPVGDTVTLQVIAHGFQTYGQIYKIDKLSMSMEVRLSRPAAQYSVYKPPTPDAGAGSSPGSGNNSGSGKSGGSPPSSPPPDSGSKSSGSSGQADPPPNGSQSQPAPK